MPLTREIPFPKHCGSDHLMIRQEWSDTYGYWIDLGLRNTKLPMTSPQELEQPGLGKSGSSNAHARLSPSDSERWGDCTAAIAAEQEAAEEIFKLDFANVQKLVPYLETFPDELHPHEVRAIEIVKQVESGKLKLSKLTPEQKADIKRSEGNRNSREGTRAHDFAEAIFAGRRTVKSIPEDFQMHVAGYIGYCKAITPEGADVFVEHKVPLFYHPEETGTADYVALTNEKVVVADLKYGAGKLVEMTDNRQLAIYGLSVVREAEESGMYFFEPDTIVEIHVYQPRHHEAASLKPWIMSLKDLEDFCAAIGEAASHVMKGEGLVFAPGPACYWCKVGKVGCKAKADAALDFLDLPSANLTHEELLEGLPDEKDLAELDGVTPAAIKKLPAAERLVSRLEYATNGKVSLLPDEMLVMLCERGDAIKGLIDDAWEYLEGRALAGEGVPGVKIVMGREGNRQWADEAAAKVFFAGQKLKQEDYLSFDLLGPAVIEKIPAIASKLHPKTGTARTRTRFNELITRSPAKKVMALASDNRPAISSDIDEMPDDEVDPLEDCG